MPRRVRAPRYCENTKKPATSFPSYDPKFSLIVTLLLETTLVKSKINICTVRHLSFGRNVPGRTDPMDGVLGTAEKVKNIF